MEIKTAENIQILAGAFIDEPNGKEKSLVQKVRLNYRNDGYEKPDALLLSETKNVMYSPSENNGQSVWVCFPVSNSGMLIGNMKGKPGMLSAYVFLTASFELDTRSVTSYTRNIYLVIEYN